jgi:hypothetical protein
MFTPVLNPNSPTPSNTNTNSTPSVSQTHVQLGKILRQHDPNATRLCDFINHVKVFPYNSTELRWENNSYIEGSLFAYQRQQDQAYPSYAFAIINGKQHFLQQVTLNMTQQTDGIRLFYEIVGNEKHDIFCLHFLNENECLRINAFINHSIQKMKAQQTRITTTGEPQPTQTNGETTPVNVYRQQTPVLASSRPTSTPITMSNNNTQDPTLSLKRLLNIPNPNGLDNETVLPQQQNPIKLIPPSAFEIKPSTPPSPIGAERSKNRLSQVNPLLNREQFRNVLLDLVQNNDHFLDIIHQACVTHSSQ